MQSGGPCDGKIQRQHAENNFTVGFTVKIICLGAIDADARRKVIYEISVRYAREPIQGDRSRKANSLPLNCLRHFKCLKSRELNLGYAKLTVRSTAKRFRLGTIDGDRCRTTPSIRARPSAVVKTMFRSGYGDLSDFE